MEVSFCVEEQASGALNLWYGQHPLRKWLPLIGEGTSLGPGCYVRYFAGSDAVFPKWCDIPATCKQDCPTPQCLAGYRTATEQWAASNITLDVDCHREEDSNLQGYTDAQIQAWAQGLISFYETIASGFSLSSTQITLTAEWCDSVPMAGLVHLDAIRFLPASCLCSDNLPCDGHSDRPTCHALPDNQCVSRPRDGACGASSLGCAGPPGPGTDCVFAAGDAAFPGKTECIDGAYVCAMQ
jgi:hypothetical protein